MAGKIYDCEQGTEEWFATRIGKVTASRVVGILKGSKGSYLASRKNYMAELICERLTGNRADSFTSEAMRWGTETEPAARGAFEYEEATDVATVGFIDHPTIEGFGASPDGLVFPNSGLEIKCPNTATHLDLLEGGKIKFDYIVQMHVCMMCAEVDTWHFVDFDPRLPQGLNYFHKLIEKDPVLTAEIETEVILFLAELSAKEKTLRERMAA